MSSNESKGFGGNNAVKVASLAVAAAIVAVFTMVVRVPMGTGYLNLCDVAIVFVSVALGPVTGLVAGGLGPAIADLAGGYAQWAPISLVVHGLEGLLVALAARKIPGAAGKVVAGIVCVAVVTLGYWLLSGITLTTLSAALADIPGNFVQSLAGAVVGTALAAAVEKAWPPVRSLAW